MIAVVMLPLLLMLPTTITVVMVMVVVTVMVIVGAPATVVSQLVLQDPPDILGPSESTGNRRPLLPAVPSGRATAAQTVVILLLLVVGEKPSAILQLHLLPHTRLGPAFPVLLIRFCHHGMAVQDVRQHLVALPAHRLHELRIRVIQIPEGGLDAGHCILELGVFKERT